MKQLIYSCLATIAFLVMLAFHPAFQTSIIGRVNPVGAANMAWAVSGRDSVSSNIVNGAFSFETRQGIYKVVIDGVAPYKDAVLENISVKDGQTVDVGEIVLQR